MRWFDSYFQKSAIYTSDRCGKSKGVIYVKTRLRRSNTHFEGASFKLAIANAIETVTTEWLRLWNTWVMSRNMTRKCKRIPFFRRLLWRVGLFGGLQHCYFSPSEAFGSPWQSCQSTCSVWHLLNPPTSSLFKCRVGIVGANGLGCCSIRSFICSATLTDLSPSWVDTKDSRLVPTLDESSSRPLGSPQPSSLSSSPSWAVQAVTIYIQGVRSDKKHKNEIIWATMDLKQTYETCFFNVVAIPLQLINVLLKFGWQNEWQHAETRLAKCADHSLG